MNNQLRNGMILLVVGILLMLFSQSSEFAQEISVFGAGVFLQEEDTLLINILFYLGFALLIGGGVLTIRGAQSESGSDTDG